MGGLTLLKLGKDPLLHIASFLHPHRLIALTETCLALNKLVKDEADMLTTAFDFRKHCGAECLELKEKIQRLGDCNARFAFLYSQQCLGSLSDINSPIAKHAARAWAISNLEGIKEQAGTSLSDDDVTIAKLEEFFEEHMQEKHRDMYESYIEYIRQTRVRMQWLRFSPKPQVVIEKIECTKKPSDDEEWVLFKIDYTAIFTTPGGTVFTLDDSMEGGGKIVHAQPDVDEIDRECDEYKAFEQGMLDDSVSHVTSMTKDAIASGQSPGTATGDNVKMTMIPGPDYIAPMTANGYPYPSFEW